METKTYKKPLHTYKVEFKIYGDYVIQETHITAFSPKQARKFFYDWWKNHHTTQYAVVVMVSQLDDKFARELCRRVTDQTIEERFENQQDYIYRKKGKPDGR